MATVSVVIQPGQAGCAQEVLPHAVRECRLFASCIAVAGEPCDLEAVLAADYVLFLRAGEVPEGDRFAAYARFLPAGKAAETEGPHLRLSAWWYFRYPWLRSLGPEDSAVLVPSAWLRGRDVWGDREALVDPARLHRRVCRDRPLFHDYSWVGTPRDLHAKVRGNDEADWEGLLGRELAVALDDRVGARHRDLVFGKSYVVVEPRVHIALFTDDWHSAAAPAMLASCGRRRTGDGGRPAILEIGSWEGRSAAWFLDTFPGGSLTCVDTFEGSADQGGSLALVDLRHRFRHNVRPHAARVCVRVGPSRRRLLGLVAESFDIAYVDGSHEAADVLCDLVMAWALLKPGGVLLCDDYRGFAGVQTAADAFMGCCACEVLCDAYQLHLLKPCSSPAQALLKPC